MQGTGTLLLCAVFDGEKKRNDVNSMVGVEVGKEDAVYSERVEVGAEHAADRA